METSNKSSIFVKTMLFVMLAIVLTVGVTYAYFRANITGVESASTISIGGATLKIVYEGTETITAENVIPGWSGFKYFNVDVTNTAANDISISYDINLVVENNNFDTEGEINSWLQYYLYECDSADDKVCDSYLDGDYIYTQSGGQLVSTITRNKSGKTYYALEIVFPNLDEEQSQIGIDGNPLYFSGYVTLSSSKQISKRSFADDSWETIASNAETGNADLYAVGDEKEVEMDMNDDGIPESYTVRIANNSNYDCVLDSKTACGFVVEFVDIVEQRQMNPTDTNVGGWALTEMSEYLDRNFLSKLPNDLQNVIIDKLVVSGHGSTETENLKEWNWIYLLSPKEVYGDCTDSNCFDTAYSSTRQLDYYANLGVTTKNYSGAIKKYNGVASNWWFRAADSANTTNFSTVSNYGSLGVDIADMSYGIAPAFCLFDGERER